jgi:DNA-directed RNA polymerase subunit RPC12/RpoP
MRKCRHCGGHLHRVHRTFVERLQYMAIYACRDCHAEEFAPREYRMHFGPHTRCPHCGTHRLSRLREPDRIDPMHSGFLNWLERLAGGRLFHCRYCRIQFYDRRPLPGEMAAVPEETIEPAAPVKAGGGDVR